MEKFDQEHPEEAHHLRGELMAWFCAVGRPGEAPGETIADQIEYNVAQIRNSGTQISVEDYLDGLFSPNPAGQISADIIMGRFQLD